MSSELAMIRKWRPEIDLLKKRTKAYTTKENLVAFYGSSSIRLWEEMAIDLAPHQVINLGFGGSSYRWCDHFFDEVFEDIDPEEIILYAGDNDLGNEVPENEILESVLNILQKIDAKYGKIQVSIISVKPSPNRLYLKAHIEGLNATLKSLIQSRPKGSFINVYSDMLRKGDVRPEFYLDDELHMNKKGYEIWKKVVKMHLDSKESINGRN